MREVKLIMCCRAKELSVFNRLSYVEETVFIHFLFALDCVCAGLSFSISVMPVEVSIINERTLSFSFSHTKEKKVLKYEMTNLMKHDVSGDCFSS
jgi:hypothetical protein